jgi:N-methylhydantoinase A
VLARVGAPVACSLSGAGTPRYLPRVSGWALGVDVGGTFTDAVLASADGLYTAKVPTTPADQSEGVMDATARALGRAGAAPADVDTFAHGMTVATNALLEERGARTALITTEGFTDVLELARQNRAHLYRLCEARPEPLVPPERRFGVVERNSPTAVVTELDEGALHRALDRLEAAEVESVAICLLHSWARPEHEARVAAAVTARLPGVHVSASHDLLAVFREYERTSTTVIDAYLSPLLAGYLDRLAERASGIGLPAPEIMRSSGGLASAAEAARHGAWAVLSGPAAGAVGAAGAGVASGSDHVLSFDMGGTSCDVAVIDDGEVRQSSEQQIGGRPLQLPMVDVHTVGAGGGSIAWADPGGALRVGPRSAGALPGPAAYGRGGTEPTVTDANLLLGYLDARTPLAGGVQLDLAAARAAVGRLADALGLELLEAAAGIVRVADEEMLRALRVATVERGVDPRRYALVAFGGAGPMHAVRLAEQLGVTRVLCPPAAGVLSALGLATADRQRDAGRTVLMDEDGLRAGRAAGAVAELAAAAQTGMPEARLSAHYDIRYRGQSFELEVAGALEADARELRASFEAAHERRYGYRDPETPIELVNARVTAVQVRPTQAGGPPVAGTPTRTSRAAHFDGRKLETTVLRGAAEPGARCTGPAVWEQPEATVVIPPGWEACADERGTLVLTPA